MEQLSFDVHIFESTTKHGPISPSSKFYPKSWTTDKIKQDFLERRLLLGKENGFDGKKIIVPIQKSETTKHLYPDGKYILITKQLIENYDDLWDLNLYADTLIIDNNLPGIVLGFPAADCPILIIEDKANNICALSQCGAEYINRELPISTLNSLKEVANTKEKDFRIYISSCAKVNHYIYDKYPKWATNKKVWTNNIHISSNKYHINLENAIVQLLLKNNIKLSQIYINPKDTITDPTLYSNSASHNQTKDKLGRQLIGCFYEENLDKSKVYQK